MKLGSMEICYIPYNKSNYEIAQEKMARLTVNEINSIVVGTTFIMLYQFNTLMAKTDVLGFTKKVETKGNEILDLVQIIGYWAAVVFAAIDIVKAFKKQDIAGLIAIACKYAVAVGILYGLPDIFDIFRDLFK